MRKLSLLLVALFLLQSHTTLFGQDMHLFRKDIQMNQMDALHSEMMHMFTKLMEDPGLLLTDEMLPPGLSMDDLAGYTVEITIEVEMVSSNMPSGMDFQYPFMSRQFPASIMQVNDPMQVIQAQAPIYIQWDDQNWHPNNSQQPRMKKGSIGNWQFQIGPDKRVVNLSYLWLLDLGPETKKS